jgi:DNA-binding NtrC family response regulator
MNEGSTMRHVLVVDDCTVIRKTFRRVLAGMSLKITETSDARQALAVCSLSMPHDEAIRCGARADEVRLLGSAQQSATSLIRSLANRR